MKRYFSLSLAAVLVILMGACGPGFQGTTEEPAGDTARNLPEAQAPVLSPDSLEKDSLAEPRDTRPYFYKRFSGTINGELPISFHLLRKGELLSGSYSYDRLGRPLMISQNGPVEDSNRVQLKEKDPDNLASEAPAGIFTGDFFSKTRIAGTWQAPTGEVSLPFLLEEAYPAGSVSLTLRHYERKTGSCGDEECLSISFTYPEIDPQAYPTLGPAFNKQVRALLKALLVGGEKAEKMPSLSLEAASDSAIREFIQMKAEFGDDGIWNWTRECDVTVFTNGGMQLSLALLLYDYSGGAHGNPYQHLLNYDLKTGKAINLSDVILPKYIPQLTDVTRKYLKLLYGGSESKTLEELGFLVPDREFALSDNFYLTPAGIGFVYNPYEIGPYAMGFVEVFVPMEEIGRMRKGL